MKHPLKSQNVFRKSGFTLIELLTVIAIIGILAAILIPVVGAVRESARKSKCLSHMRQIGLAVLSYESEHNALPGPIFRRVRRPYVTDTYDHKELNWVLEDYVGEKSEVWDCPTNAGIFNATLNPGNVTFLLNNRSSSTLPPRFFGYPGSGGAKYATNEGHPKSLEQIVAAQKTGPGRLMTELTQIWMISDVDGLNYNAASIGSSAGSGSVPLSEQAGYVHEDGRNYVFFDGHAEFRKQDNFPP